MRQRFAEMAGTACDKDAHASKNLCRNNAATLAPSLVGTTSRQAHHTSALNVRPRVTPRPT